MADNSIDSLSIEITASARGANNAIDTLVKKLASLNSALNNYNGNSQYVQGFKNIASGIEGISDAVNSIDEQKLKTMSKTLKTLSNLSGINLGKSSNGSTQKYNKNVEDMTNQMAKLYNMDDKASKSELGSVISDMYDAINSGDLSGLDALYDKFSSIIMQAGKMAQEVDQYWKDIADTIKQGNFNVDASPSDFPDINTYRSMRAATGMPTMNRTGRGDAGAYLEELTGEQVNNEVDAFYRLYDIVQQVEDSFISLGQAMKQGYDSSGDITESFQTIWDAFAKVRDASSGVATNIQEVSNATQSIPTETNGFENIAEGLQRISGITIPDMSNLKIFTNQIANLGSDKVINATYNIPQIANELSQLGSIVIPDMSNLQIFASNVARFGQKNAQNAATTIPFIADGMKQLAGVGEFPSGANLASIADSVYKFGMAKVEKAVTNIPQIAESLKKLITSLNGLPEVSSNVVALTGNLATLASYGGRVGTGATTASKGLNLFSNSAKKARGSALSLASVIGKIYATYWLLFRAFGVLADAIDLSSSLTEIQNVVDVTFGNMSSAVDDFCENSIQEFGLSELAAKQYASRFQAMGSAMGITSEQVKKATSSLSNLPGEYGKLGTSLADVSLNLTRLTADMASFYNVEQDDVAEDLEAIFTGMTRPLTLAA